eukprot:gnl/Spiro4/21750_TR10656_c0_g1_i1.p1 gnl/Spiro4/21750_TR10656_c0_g1~~gnl/Spiro4/21750_TR10656_c0_g1_i1.p1  ORF type:complete len:366 (+),score=72.67 gnl/Spiro4/21750_TR10656_c0_g1_i1:83-1180(+)
MSDFKGTVLLLIKELNNKNVSSPDQINALVGTCVREIRSRFRQLFPQQFNNFIEVLKGSGFMHGFVHTKKTHLIRLLDRFCDNEFSHVQAAAPSPKLQHRPAPSSIRVLRNFVSSDEVQQHEREDSEQSQQHSLAAVSREHSESAATAADRNRDDENNDNDNNGDNDDDADDEQSERPAAGVSSWLNRSVQLWNTVQTNLGEIATRHEMKRPLNINVRCVEYPCCAPRYEPLDMPPELRDTKRMAPELWDAILEELNKDAARTMPVCLSVTIIIMLLIPLLLVVCGYVTGLPILIPFGIAVMVVAVMLSFVFFSFRSYSTEDALTERINKINDRYAASHRILFRVVKARKSGPSKHSLEVTVMPE